MHYGKGVTPVCLSLLYPPIGLYKGLEYSNDVLVVLKGANSGY